MAALVSELLLAATDAAANRSALIERIVVETARLLLYRSKRMLSNYCWIDE